MHRGDGRYRYLGSRDHEQLHRVPRPALLEQAGQPCTEVVRQVGRAVVDVVRRLPDGQRHATWHIVGWVLSVNAPWERTSEGHAPYRSYAMAVPSAEVIVPVTGPPMSGRRFTRA